MMKLIRWLMSNIILIAFVLALTYAYVYWDNLTGEDTPAGKLVAYLSTEYEEVSEFLNDYGLGGDDAAEGPAVKAAPEVTETATVPQVAMPPRPQRQVSPQPVPPQAMLQPDVRQPAPTREPAMRSPARGSFPEQAMRQQAPSTRMPPLPPRRESMPTSQSGAVEQPAPTREPAMRYPARGPFPEQAMMQQAPSTRMPPLPPRREPMQQPMPTSQSGAVEQPAPTREPAMRYPARGPFPEQAMMQQAPPTRMPPLPPGREPMQQPMPTSQSGAAEQPGSNTRELWISAREEYHRGNIDVSIRNYREVIAGSTDNYDAYGELGNVYLSRGSSREAAEAYFEAAAILIRTGQIGRARSLLPMLGRLDRAKAEELNQLIRGASS